MNQPSTTASTQNQPTVSSNTPGTSGKTASVRVANAKCPSGTSKCTDQGIKIQVKINDECDPGVLNTTLTKFPKAATGNAGSLKLKEDGVVGGGTNAAFTACKPYLVPKGQAPTQQPTTGAPLGNTEVQDVGSAVTADQYATLSA